ncbi:MAG: hypothetical protein Q9222_005215 [Ikaeria aurantiellina]
MSMSQVTKAFHTLFRHIEGPLGLEVNVTSSSAYQKVEALEQVLAAANHALSEHSASINYDTGTLMPSTMCATSLCSLRGALTARRRSSEPPGTTNVSSQIHRPATNAPDRTLAHGGAFPMDGPTYYPWGQMLLPHFPDEAIRDIYRA